MATSVNKSWQNEVEFSPISAEQCLVGKKAHLNNRIMSNQSYKQLTASQIYNRSHVILHKVLLAVDNSISFSTMHISFQIDHI